MKPQRNGTLGKRPRRAGRVKLRAAWIEVDDTLATSAQVALNWLREHRGPWHAPWHCHINRAPAILSRPVLRWRDQASPRAHVSCAHTRNALARAVR